MPTASIANQIDHHVFVELVAIIDGKLGDEYHCFGVVTIDVENRRLNHLGDVSAILR